MTERATADLTRIIESARRLGVEMDETEAIQWLAAIAAAQSENPITVDAASGVFGHKVSLLDFSPQELQRFRAIGQFVSFPQRPGVVETALALSGSAAQSKIQTYPGDCDYFERVNIKASTQAAACLILAELLREKALGAAKGPTYCLTQVRFGEYAEAVLKGGKPINRGSSIGWSPAEIQMGEIVAQATDGTPVVVRWHEAALTPGWCKLDWIVIDPIRGQLTNVSNMLDVTWEAPDGTVTPLDGYLDPYFQEVYLEAEAIPIFSRLVEHMGTDALDGYVQRLENEIGKYVTIDYNYGKAAKRMYNVFRLTGRYEEAAWIRELFDEPATVLYQVWSLIRTIDEAAQGGVDITLKQLLAQSDQLILEVVRVLDGPQEVEIVRHLLRLRDSLIWRQFDQAHEVAVEAARAEVINVVNNFFYDRLTALPTIKLYMDDFGVP